MYLVTNRDIKSNTGPVDDVFRDVPNRKGPNTLQVATIKKSGGKWNAKVLDDKLTDLELNQLKEKYKLTLDPSLNYYRDLEVACKISDQAQRENRNILIFVHGYNNDVKDVVQRATQLEKHYGVIVLPFSWPANGGGIKGVADYKDDKNDAKASFVALDRLLSLISRNLRMITENNRVRFYKEADQKHPNDPERRDSLYTKLVNKNCPYTLNFMLHSMGNYLLKQMLKSTISKGTGLIFDNVILASADTNNLDHSLWMDRIRFKRRMYVTINENDQALAASRMKSGQDQLARLGHVLFGLNAERAHYVNFTESPWVGNSHAYFEGNARSKNKFVQRFFHAALNGRSADDLLKFRAEFNCYDLKA